MPGELERMIAALLKNREQAPIQALSLRLVAVSDNLSQNPDGVTVTYPVQNMWGDNTNQFAKWGEAAWE